MAPKWAWPGSHDPLSKLWYPHYNFRMNQAIRFKFGMDIEE